MDREAYGERRVMLTQEEDIADIAKQEAETFSDAWSEQAVRESWMQRQTILLSIKASERLIGYAILYYVLDEAEIARIAVRTDVRRSGAGTELFRKIMDICAEKKIARILLDVRRSNESAIAFYRKQGFVEDGIRRNFYTAPQEDAILMSMETGCQIMH